MFRGIRFKLSLITVALIALITAGTSLIVVNIMDNFLLGELIKRGFSISRSAVTSAGFSILSNDRLALDNLAAKIKENQKDLLYVAIVDEDGVIKAHSELGEIGIVFYQIDGELMRNDKDHSVKRVKRGGYSSYEFKSSIIFAGKKVGDVYIGIDADTLLISQVGARKKIFLVSASVLALGVVGTFFLSTFITAPIKRLAEGVSKLKSGRYEGEIKVVSRDELGELTKNFNEMAKVIMDQKNGLEHYANNLEEAYVSTVRILAATIDARDKYTLGHSTRVAKLSLVVGEKLGLKDDELKDLEMACLFHDVGKISVPDNILHKRASLNNDEYKLMMRHPKHGAEILQLADSLHKYIPAVMYHHEWYNGYGYPAGLKGNEIPLFASIIAIADAYDAIISSRPYRESLSRDEAVKEISRYKGTQFAPDISDLFIEVLRDYENGENGENGKEFSFIKVTI